MSNSYHILVIEDDEQFIGVILDVLKLDRYQTTTVTSGQAALEALSNFSPDLILSDMHLPDFHGIELLKQIQSLKPNIPYIFLTAEDQETDIVLGLELGANDYILKPFRSRELLARIRKHLLPKSNSPTLKPIINNIKENPPFHIDLLSYEVKIWGHALDLTTKEFELTKYFHEHPGQALSREQILNRIWLDEYDISDRIVDSHVSHLRKKIEAQLPQKQQVIKTIRGIGYKWVFTHH